MVWARQLMVMVVLVALSMFTSASMPASGAHVSTPATTRDSMTVRTTQARVSRSGHEKLMGLRNKDDKHGEGEGRVHAEGMHERVIGGTLTAGLKLHGGLNVHGSGGRGGVADAQLPLEAPDPDEGEEEVKEEEVKEEAGKGGSQNDDDDDDDEESWGERFLKASTSPSGHRHTNPSLVMWIALTLILTCLREISPFQAFASSFLVILATEIGDKTFFIAAILTMRHSRLHIYLG